MSENKIIRYLKDSKSELKKVSWPTKQETIKHTLMVIGFSVFVAVFLGVLDFAFTKLLTIIL